MRETLWYEVFSKKQKTITRNACSIKIKLLGRFEVLNFSKVNILLIDITFCETNYADLIDQTDREWNSEPENYKNIICKF